MKLLLIIVSLGGAVLASNAFAANLSIQGNVRETLQASDNYFMNLSPSGATAQSLTAGTLDFLARTPSTSYLLDAYYSYYKYFGPGASDTTLTWGTPAHANFRIDHTEQLTTYNFAASWNRSDTVQTALAETGVASGRGSINTYAVNGGLVHDLSRTDSLAWTANASWVTYTDPNSVPSTDVVSTATWRHSLNSTTAFNNFVSFDWYSPDNIQQSQRLFWKLMTGLDSQLSRRLNFTGNFGWAFVNAYQNGVAQSSPSASFNSFVPQVGSANTFLADILLAYQLSKTTSISFTAAQTVSPLSNGELQKGQSIGLSLAHKINHVSGISLSARFFHTSARPGSALVTPVSGSDFFSASADYYYQLTRDWVTNLSYTYRQRNDEAGIAQSNTILFGLSYDFTLLGNPTAINIAQKERARQRARQSAGYAFPAFH